MTATVPLPLFHPPAGPGGESTPPGSGGVHRELRIDRVRRGARISACRRYRYRLERRWSAAAVMTIVLLNPSTADANADDRTSGRCIGFARDAGCGGVDLVNLMAWRSVDPRALRQASDPIGPDNHAWISATVAANHPGPVVVAWGAGAGYDRVQTVLELLAGLPLLCLGVTKDGHPRHPLYVKTGTPLVPFDGDLLSAAACRAGYHRWSEWTPAGGDLEEELQGCVCRCGAEQLVAADCLAVPHGADRRWR